MLGAMDFGIADHRQRAGREQAAQIAVASFADPPNRGGLNSTHIQGTHVPVDPGMAFQAPAPGSGGRASGHATG
jgi:hypothetical protein